MTLLPEQREALIDALLEYNRDDIASSFDRIYDFLDDVLVNGRVGYADMADDQLVLEAQDADLDDRLAELGIKV